MRYLRIYLASLMVVLLAITAGFLLVGDIPSVPREDSVSVIVVLQKQLELRALNKSLGASRMTRQARYEQVIRYLQATAQSMQQSLLAYLQEQKSLGRVQDYQSFWIVNAVAVTATPQVIEEIAQHPEVAAVYKDEDLGPIEPIKPIEIKKVFDQKTGAEPGLKAIKADCLWAKGINGAGTLVCNLDTGVNGNHVALYNRWRGNNGATALESWFDPYNHSHFPVDDAGDTHGTLTMGVITGVVNDDTMGVAFSAEWIAANYLEQEFYNYSDDFIFKKFLACFQWIADPDGDPTTIEDVPDVVNGSFRIGIKCSNFLWIAIDAIEAAGVVAIFGAGNDGKYGAFTVGNPASRATAPVNAFAVGAVDANNVIADFSSRGPSPCDSVSIKPEVVAPGVKIRSLSGDGYGLGTGTSVAAPHVAGAVALLRQINPDATVEEIKYALLNSAVDLGPKGEDNGYGMGIIDVNAAAKLLPPNIRPNINISRFTLNGEDTHSVQKGRTIEMVIYLINSGLSAQNVSAKLVTSDPYCQISEPTFSFGVMYQNDLMNNAPRPFLVTVDHSAPEGHNIVFGLEIVANNGEYKKINRFSAVVNKRGPRVNVQPLNVEFNLNKCERSRSVITLTNVGSDNLEYEIGEGLPSNSSSHSLQKKEMTSKKSAIQVPFETSCSNTFLAVIRDSVGDMPRAYNFDIAQINVAQVDTLITFCQYIDSTEQVLTGYFSSLLIEMVLDSGNTFVQPASSRYIDIYIDTDQNILTGKHLSGLPSSRLSLIDIGFDIHIFGPDETFCPNNNRIVAIILKYTADGKRDLKYGGAIIPLDIKSNKMSVIIPTLLLEDDDGNMNIAVFGAVFGNFAIRDTIETDGISNYDLVPDVGHGLIGIDTTPIPWLTEVPRKGIISPSGNSKDIYLVADAAQLDNFIYASNIYISTNDPDQPLITIPVKVSVGNSKRPVIPEQFQLYQNYPNPFNSSTTIEYQLSEAGRVTIEVFNLLGQKVKTLVDVDKIVGYHQVVWDGKDSLGKDAASGVYLFRMKIKDFVERKKLLLIR